MMMAGQSKHGSRHSGHNYQQAEEHRCWRTGRRGVAHAMLEQIQLATVMMMMVMAMMMITLECDTSGKEGATIASFF